MISKSRRPFAIYAAVFAAALIVSSAAVWLAARLFPTLPAYAPAPPPPASLLSPNALFAPADRTRLGRIGTALQKSKPVADADLDWAISLLQRGPAVNSPPSNGSFAIMTMSQLCNHKSMTPAQMHRLAKAVLPFADDPLPAERAPVNGLQAADVSVQHAAVLTLGSLNDEAADAKLEQLAQSSPTPKIRRTAGAFVARRHRELK